MNQDYKIVFSGPMGAGKTQAVSVLSDIPVISTEEKNTDIGLHSKTLTTVGMDYGVLNLSDGQSLGLYGTPGQERFDFMWSIITEGALGVVLLINHTAVDPIGDLSHYLETFQSFYNGRIIIGVTQMDMKPEVGFHIYQQHLAEKNLNIPAFPVDMRERDDVMLLVETIISSLEAVRLLD